MNKNEPSLELKIFNVLSYPFAIIWQGYVLSLLWAWFVVKIFNVPVLNVAQAIGLAGTVACFCGVWQLGVEIGIFQAEKDRECNPPADRLFIIIALRFLSPAILLLWGWLIRHFI